MTLSATAAVVAAFGVLSLGSQGSVAGLYPALDRAISTKTQQAERGFDGAIAQGNDPRGHAQEQRRSRRLHDGAGGGSDTAFKWELPNNSNHEQV